MFENPSLDETIKRLQAFEQAGADVLFAPGLPDLDAVRAVCSAVSKPVNFMVGIRGQIILGDGSRCRRREANQSCYIALPGGNDGVPRGCD